MDPLTAIGLASNVLSFIDTGTKLCKLINEYSSISGAPKEVVSTTKRLELVLSLIKELDQSGRARLDNEKLAMKICSDEAEEMRIFLEGLKIASDVPLGKENVLKRFGRNSSRSAEKTWKAFKALRGKEKMGMFQNSLHRILGLIQMQQQNRIEITTLRVEDKAGILVQNSESILRGLNELQLVSRPSPTSTSTMQTETMFMVPLPRNPGFLGREETIAILEKKLGALQRADPMPTGQFRNTALYGLGGIGKSQIALEYAFRYRDCSSEASVFWIHASTMTRFLEDYRRIAAAFQLPGREDPQVDIPQIVQNWFESQYERPWLMVVDNVDDKQIFDTLQTGKSIYEYLPRFRQGRVTNGTILFTSRSKDISMDLVGDPIEVPPMKSEEARMLLGNLIEGDNTPELDVLLQELEHLPLAIMQAVSFMVKRRKTVPQYLTLFHHSEASRQTLLEHKFVSLGRQASSFDSVAATWTMSFQQIQCENSNAADFLYLMCLFDRESIPLTLINGNLSDPAAIDVAVGLLESYSFISADETGTNYSMHRLVQSATRAWLMGQQEKFGIISSQALQILSSKFPNGDFEYWEICAQYLPHAESVMSHTSEIGSEADRLARGKLLGNMAWYFKEQGHYVNARKLVERSIQVYESGDDEIHAEVLQVKRILAIITEMQGHVEESIHLYRETLENQENLLGPDHLDTLDTADSLAMAFANTYPTENLDSAEVLANRALVGREAFLPPDHAKILTSLRTLGWVFYRQGRYAESEVILRKCKSKRELVIGKHHPETSSTANELALVLFNLDPPRYEEAERLLRSSANLTNLLCGSEHPSTIITYSNLSGLLRRLGKYEEAEVLQRNQLRLSCKILGPDHPTTLWCIASLTAVLFQQEKFSQAESLLREELGKRQDLIDNDVPDVLLLVDFHGQVCKRSEEAEKIFQKAIDGFTKIFGPNDVRTLKSRHGLADVLRKRGKYDEAEIILLDVLSKRQEILGKTHEETLATSSLLGRTLYSAKRYSDAEIVFLQILAYKEDTLGSAHHSTLSTRDNFEAALWKQEKWKEWEPYCRQSLETRQMLAPGDYHTLRVTSNLWFVLEKLGKSESEKIFQELLQEIKKITPALLKTKKFGKDIPSYEMKYFEYFCGIGRLPTSLDEMIWKLLNHVNTG